MCVGVVLIDLRGEVSIGSHVPVFRREIAFGGRMTFGGKLLLAGTIRGGNGATNTKITEFWGHAPRNHFTKSSIAESTGNEQPPAESF